ncbi:MAG: hypothetical protein ACSLE3_06755 [Microbacteriaceae bacterium]
MPRSTFTYLLIIVLCLATFSAGYRTGELNTPRVVIQYPAPQQQLRCFEDQVRAYWWTGDDHTLESCLQLDDIDPRVRQYAEEVIGQQATD